MRRSTLVCSLALALLGGAPLAGCSFTRAPSTTLAEARVVQSTDDAVVVEFTLSAENPNEDPLPLRSIRYTLTLDGKTVFTGTRSPEATIRPNSTQLFRVPAPIRLDPADRSREHAYTLAGSITYVEPGTFSRILFDADVIQPSASFSTSGQIRLDAAP
ncbi:MAG: LEA type 2 family protein [Phycisphaerales bacterium]